MTTPANISMNSGTTIPQLGFGVFQIDNADVEAAVGKALEVGYRHIDTAAMYQNEDGVGRAVAASGIPRDEIFITTKLGNPDHGYDTALRAFDASLQRLGMDYVDLYLIHWPRPANDQYIETWRAFEKVHADGRAKAIGVSNFTIEHLRRVMDETETVPALNQIETHPYLAQRELMAFHAEHGIVSESWSPIGRGRELLTDPAVTAVADRQGRTAAQVVIRWHLQRGSVVIPKSVTPSRIEENFAVFDFTLTDDDMAALDALDRDGRMGPDPDDVN